MLALLPEAERDAALLAGCCGRDGYFHERCSGGARQLFYNAASAWGLSATGRAVAREVEVGPTQAAEAYGTNAETLRCSKVKRWSGNSNWCRSEGLEYSPGACGL